MTVEDVQATGGKAGAEAAAIPTAPAQGVAQLGRTIGSIVAPTTLVTGALYYFGLQNTYYFFNYFGVDSTVLHLTPVDYITRSVGPLVGPIVIAAILALIALWGDGALRARLAKGHPTRLRTLVPVLWTVGLLFVAAGVLSPFAITDLTLVAAARLGIAIGVLLVGYALRMRRHLSAKEHKGGGDLSGAWAARWEWALAFLVVAVSIFVASYDYGAASGTSNARQFVAGLRNDPGVALYSARSLSLHAPGVRELRCPDLQAAYGFRYDGLRLVVESGDQYLLLPTDWTRTQGVAFLIPQSNSVRLAFYPPSTGRDLQLSPC